MKLNTASRSLGVCWLAGSSALALALIADLRKLDPFELEGPEVLMVLAVAVPYFAFTAGAFWIAIQLLRARRIGRLGRILAVLVGLPAAAAAVLLGGSMLFYLSAPLSTVGWFISCVAIAGVSALTWKRG